MDFVAGARMHAAIAALSAGVPVVPMAYCRKFAGVFGTLGYQHVVDCKSQTAEDIIRTIQWGFEFREELKRDVEAALKMVNERLNAYEEAVTGEIHRIIGDMANGFS
jgi:colanic acid/amylovoran biosynthesis protein